MRSATSIFGIIFFLNILFFLPNKVLSSDNSFVPQADLTSQMIYRGEARGTSPHILPALGFNSGNANLTFKGIQPINFYPDSDAFQELVTQFSYTLETSTNVDITPKIQNRFDTRMPLLEFDEASTGHLLQSKLEISGQGDIAPDITASYSFWGRNAIEPTMYIEAGTNFAIGESELRPFVSGQQSEEGGFVDLDYDGDFVINQVGMEASRDISLSSSTSIPMNILLAVNPKTEQVFTALSVSFN